MTETVTDTTLGNRSANWTYDAVGNRLTQVETETSGTTTTTYVYDNNDRLEPVSNFVFVSHTMLQKKEQRWLTRPVRSTRSSLMSC